MDYRAVKRVFDVCVSAAALVALAPLLAGIAIAVRLGAPGPALYRSLRLGVGGRTFEMLKFRTMQVNAPDVRNPDGSTYSGTDDPRITRFGYWLRRTSLDELPQLWNVVRGDMSLVGPRPELPDQVRYYSADDRRRLDVRPGITGLAQVSGRNDLSWTERRALDVHYVASINFREDLRILRLTIPRVMQARGIFGSGVVGKRPERDDDAPSED
ncbi:MAG: sugar transferase [Acidobacteria bacterium]|nr:sugar transferase [Acidobacteriota bacterium]